MSDRMKKPSPKKKAASRKASVASPAQRRIAELEWWKREASQVMDQIDLQAVGKELQLALGQFVGPAILPAIRSLKTENARLRELLHEYRTAEASRALVCSTVHMREVV